MKEGCSSKCPIVEIRLDLNNKGRNSDICVLLLTDSAEVNEKYTEGCAAQMCVSPGGRLATWELLLENGVELITIWDTRIDMSSTLELSENESGISMYYVIHWHSRHSSADSSGPAPCYALQLYCRPPPCGVSVLRNANDSIVK